MLQQNIFQLRWKQDRISEVYMCAERFEKCKKREKESMITVIC